MVKQGNDSVVQVLVQWESLPAEGTTWEDYDVLQRRYPQASIWGGVSSQGGENVTPDTTSTTVSV